MKITINGVVFDNPRRLDIEVDNVPAGEAFGPIDIVIRGGPLTVRGPDHAVRITGLTDVFPYLILQGGERPATLAFPTIRSSVDPCDLRITSGFTPVFTQTVDQAMIVDAPARTERDHP